MGIQGILGSVFSGLASAVIWWWFARCWKGGEVETRPGLYRADVEVEEYCSRWPFSVSAPHFWQPCRRSWRSGRSSSGEARLSPTAVPCMTARRRQSGTRSGVIASPAGARQSSRAGLDRHSASRFAMTLEEPPRQLLHHVFTADGAPPFLLAPISYGPGRGPRRYGKSSMLPTISLSPTRRPCCGGSASAPPSGRSRPPSCSSWPAPASARRPRTCRFR